MVRKYFKDAQCLMLKVLEESTFEDALIILACLCVCVMLFPVLVLQRLAFKKITNI